MIVNESKITHNMRYNIKSLVDLVSDPSRLEGTLYSMDTAELDAVLKELVPNSTVRRSCHNKLKKVNACMKELELLKKYPNSAVR